VNSGSRQAALLLHAMLPTDREWLLNQLPVNDRSKLQAMLGELTSLGIAPEPDLVKTVAHEIDVTNKKEPIIDFAGMAECGVSKIKTSGDAIEFLLSASPTDIVQILRSEPPGLIARLLRIYSWPWSDELLAQLGVIKRRNVEDAMASIVTCGPKLGEALVIQLAQQLEKDFYSNSKLAQTTSHKSSSADRSFLNKIFSFKLKPGRKNVPSRVVTREP
jgi:hypothetical protein